MLVHRSKIDRHETVFALQLLRDQIQKHVFPLHRLDKPTSGVLLFAKSAECAKLMQLQFTQHTIKKEYIAIVRGYINKPIEIDYPLQEQLDKMTDNVHKDNQSKPAITLVNPLATIEIDKPVSRYQSARFSLVSLHPLTGRKHQLRRHMKHIFHPILGDTTHGDGKQNKFARIHLCSNRLLLHAYKMEFLHPFSSVQIILTSKPGTDFTSVSDLFETRLDAAV